MIVVHKVGGKLVAWIVFPEHILCMLCGLLLIGCSSSTDPPKSVPQPASLTASDSDKTLGQPVPVVPESPFLNTRPNVHSVGGRRCAECHMEQSAAFQTTRHSRSMSRPDDVVLPVADLEHSKSGYHYRARSDSEVTIHSESMKIDDSQLPPTEYSIEYVIGSGRFGHSFLSKPDNFRVQSPLTWYSTRQCWDMSPGFDSADQMSFRRVVSARCLYCHSGNVEVRNQNEFDFVVHETTISCERCHGAGSAHAEKHSRNGSAGGVSGIDHTIVNPHHLNRVLSEAICQQCHLQGDAQIPVRGQQFDSFRPGQPLTAFRQDYRVGSSSEMTIVGHVEQLHASPCYQKSDTLTCITCHKPHHNMSDAQLPQHYRQTCLDCHAQHKCTESIEVRQSVAQDECVKCHMPAAPTEVPHVAFTHHRIGIHKDAEKILEPRSTLLYPMLSEEGFTSADVARSRGLAWLHVALSKPDVDFQQALKSARDELTLAWEGGAGDAAVAAGLATIASEIAWNEQAELWAARTLELDASPSDARMKALTIQSELYFGRNENLQALNGLQTLTELRRDGRNWFFRGLVEQNLGRTDESIRSLERSLTINPKNQGAHAALAAIYQLLKNDAKVEYHRMMAVKLGVKK